MSEKKKAKAIMVQGTMSNAGKSFLVAGLCRVFKQDGYKAVSYTHLDVYKRQVGSGENIQLLYNRDYQEREEVGKWYHLSEQARAIRSF